MSVVGPVCPIVVIKYHRSELVKIIMIIAAALLLVVGAAKSQFVGRLTGTTHLAGGIAPVPIPESLERSDEAGPEVKLVLLALWPEGFETNEMRLESGDYLFIIGNRTGLKEVNIRLDRERDERLVAVTVGGRQRDLKRRLKLTPGSYVVTADRNPNWVCRITVK